MIKFRVTLATLLAAGILMASCGGDEPNTPDIPDTPDTPVTPETTDVRVLTTTSNRAKDLDESWLSFSTVDNMSPSTIRLNP